MATLGNILKREKGVPLTGRPVLFHLSVRDDEAGRVQHKISALLLPVGEEDRLRAIEDARAYCEKQKCPDALPIEVDLRFLARALRDGEDARALLIDSQEALAALRSGLVEEQLGWLGKEYSAMIQEQYPELAPVPAPITSQEVAGMRDEAARFSVGGQP